MFLLKTNKTLILKNKNLTLTLDQNLEKRTKKTWLKQKQNLTLETISMNPQNPLKSKILPQRASSKPFSQWIERKETDGFQTSRKKMRIERRSMKRSSNLPLDCKMTMMKTPMLSLKWSSRSLEMMIRQMWRRSKVKKKTQMLRKLSRRLWLRSNDSNSIEERSRKRKERRTSRGRSKNKKWQLWKSQGKCFSQKRLALRNPSDSHLDKLKMKNKNRVLPKNRVYPNLIPKKNH